MKTALTKYKKCSIIRTQIDQKTSSNHKLLQYYIYMPQPKSPESTEDVFYPETATSIKFLESVVDIFKQNNIDLIKLEHYHNLLKGIKKLREFFVEIREKTENTITIKNFIIELFTDLEQNETNFEQKALSDINKLLRNSGNEELNQEQNVSLADSIFKLNTFQQISFGGSDNRNLAKKVLLQVLEQIDAK